MDQPSHHTRDGCDQARTIRIPIHMIEMINTLNGVTRELFMDLGRDPTPEELATEMNITPEKALMQRVKTPAPAPERA